MTLVQTVLVAQGGNLSSSPQTPSRISTQEPDE